MAGSMRFLTNLSLGILSKSVTRHIVLNRNYNNSNLNMVLKNHLKNFDKIFLFFKRSRAATKLSIVR